ncbi:cytochrome c oxidase assembly protein [Microvirga arabica]|uniref:Cytochrome c oxidase assembly protein n=2 Tax=Microvirga TaxID=186650 RepID=A0ABV6Y9M9_9HYPH
MRLSCLALSPLIVVAAGPAVAHGDGMPIGPDDLWHHWTFDPWIWVPLIIVHWLYGRGVLRLWNKAGWGRGISTPRVGAFIGGELILVISLVSPLDSLGETLFSAHMAQHTLLVAVAPPLLLAGFPGAAFPWALPRGFLTTAVRTGGARWVARALSWFLRPLPAAIMHGVALWVWHAPVLFDAALESSLLHTLEHISFFGTGLLFWQSLALSSRSTAGVAFGIAAGFLTLIHSGFLSALITFAPDPLYEWYLNRTATWGMGALEDQQLAGLLMGVPMGMVYLLACLALAARFLEPTHSSPELARTADAKRALP